MPILIAAVAVVGVLCVLDLVLTFGVIRRLREHTSMLTGGAAPPAVGLAEGESPGAFEAVTVRGEAVSSGTAGLRMVAFFSSGCPACPGQVAPFMEYLGRHHISPDSVLAVVATDNGTPAPYLDRLAKVARTCVEPPDGDIARAFRLSGFPAFCLLDADGAVAVSGLEPAELPEPATV